MSETPIKTRLSLWCGNPWLVLLFVAFAFGCDGEEAKEAKPGAPLLSQQRNLNVVKKRITGLDGSEDASALDAAGSPLGDGGTLPSPLPDVVGESDKDTKASIDSRDEGMLSDGAARPDQPAPEEMEEEPSRSSVTDVERRAETWTLGKAGDEPVYDKREIRHSNEGWFGADQDVPSDEEFTRNALRAKLLKAREKPCEGAGCGDVFESVFAEMGIRLESGTGKGVGGALIDFSGLSDMKEKQRILDAAAEAGPVLLQTPKGLALYLGSGSPGGGSRAIMARPMGGGRDSLPQEKLAVVSMSDPVGPNEDSLLLQVSGAGVFTKSKGERLAGVATSRPPASLAGDVPRSCPKTKGGSVFLSPASPHSKGPLKMILSMEKELGPHEVVVTDPKGKVVPATIRILGGPPYTVVAMVDKPKPGRYTVRLGEGNQLRACRKFRVRKNPYKKTQLDPEAVWTPRRKWGKGMERLYSAFVESLFDYPLEEDKTWPSLQKLIEDPNRNLLFNHLSLDEDKELNLKPDCADLPFFLRAYFAWKKELPFAYRTCGIGRKGRPPKCSEEILTPSYLHEEEDRVAAFKKFLRNVKRVIHSAGGRTPPRTNESDLFPVDLTRDALRPGTVYVDPFGHLLMIARWVPQAKGEYGVLMAADAQPDGTVGRRRFWRGSFLFTSSTRDVGAGFKAHRPVKFNKKEGLYTTVENKRLKSKRALRRYSETQYKGSTQDFYERMEALINPRPLDPEAMQVALVDSFEESVARRLNSVSNGEEFMKKRAYEPIEMPKGPSIFQTAGPWEDFSTPSRDMRLLISLDTVLDFPKQIRKSPERFGVLEGEEASRLSDAVEARLGQELKERSFEYIRSDGTSTTLTLQDLADRATEMEMAYNPNDCVEIRWGAPQGSEERKTCVRRAPEDQAEKMTEYRPWFVSRERPPR